MMFDFSLDRFPVLNNGPTCLGITAYTKWFFEEKRGSIFLNEAYSKKIYLVAFAHSINLFSLYYLSLVFNYKPKTSTNKLSSLVICAV